VQVQDECITLRERFLANRLGFKPSKLNVRIEAACLELLQTGGCRRREPEASNPGSRAREALPKLKSEAGPAAS
jgi:hypothetical protein